jgi:Tol biopolymer transport system component
VLYVAADEAERPQLFYVPVVGGEHVRLTEEPEGIWDYVLAPDGERVIYSALRRGVGSDLWLLDLSSGERRQVLACPEDTCNGAVWAPDGQRLAYERRGPAAFDPLLILTTIWWLDPDTGQSEDVFPDSQLSNLFPSWSADGQWLSYVTPGPGGAGGSTIVRIYDLEGGRSHAIPTQTGNPVIWHPEDETLLLTDIRTPGERPLTHLLRFDLSDAQLTDLSDVTNPEAEDRWASWSPDGAWIAIVREIRTDAGPSAGDEVWLARADGTDIRPLTSEPGISHGRPVWSPDGAYLLFRQYALAELWAQPALMRLNVETGELQQIVKPGYQPTWVP